MPNPWMKKNPALSLFLSGANAWSGAARSWWTKQARQSQADATRAGARHLAGLWTAVPPPGKTRKRRR